MEEQKQRQSEQTRASFEREDDFAALYANNVILEGNALDLKLIFGELEQHTGEAVVSQHTSVTIPWPTAKLLTYYLQVFMADYEAQNGKIRMPLSSIPPLIAIPNEAPPRQQKVIELAQTLHHQLVADIAKPDQE